MNLGFFTMPIHPLDKDWRQSLREDREAFILADELGYTEGYVGEHHTDRAETCRRPHDMPWSWGRRQPLLDQFTAGRQLGAPE